MTNKWNLAWKFSDNRAVLVGQRGIHWCTNCNPFEEKEKHVSSLQKVNQFQNKSL